MKIFAIVFAKTVKFFFDLFNKNSALPGYIVVKLCPSILKKIKLPSRIVGITGSNSKSSVTSMIIHTLREDGLVVTTNSNNDNTLIGIIYSIISDCNLKGELKSDILVFNIDEQTFKDIVEHIHFSHLVITNLLRNQVMANGNPHILFENILENIDSKTKLILNTDDPLVNSFSLYHKGKIEYFGINENKLSTVKSNSITEINYCPRCGEKLIYDYFNYATFGSYHCSSCFFKRYDNEYDITAIDDNSITVNNKDNILIYNKSFSNLYTVIASYALLKTLRIKTSSIIKNLSTSMIQNKSAKIVKSNNRTCHLLLAKNYVSYEQSLIYINTSTVKKAIILGFNFIKGKSVNNDISWLYDVNFNILNKKSITKIICIGKYAYDIAVRLKYAGFKEEDLIIETDNNKIINIIDDYGEKEIYRIYYNDLEPSFTKMFGDVK